MSNSLLLDERVPLQDGTLGISPFAYARTGRPACIVQPRPDFSESGAGEGGRSRAGFEPACPAHLPGVSLLRRPDAAPPLTDEAAANLMLDTLRAEATAAAGIDTAAAAHVSYLSFFPAYVAAGVEAGLLSPELATFDLVRLAGALRASRDRRIGYGGLKALARDCLLRRDGRVMELPQALFMRVAMGLALREGEREARAVEFYEVLSSLRFMPAAAILHSAGTCQPQFSCAFVGALDGDFDSLLRNLGDTALLAAPLAGVTSNWTRLRVLADDRRDGALPFLKAENSPAIALPRGARTVSACLETWHIDIERFLSLGAGTDRDATQGLSTVHWIPDLFMERVEADAQWTLFSPEEAPKLHRVSGARFKRAYEAYEAAAEAGVVRNFRQVPARRLWGRMLRALARPSRTAIAFKDPCNIRSPDRRRGVLHGPGPAGECTPATATDEIAACHAGAVNLAAHVAAAGLDRAALAATIATAMRMLDNAVDLDAHRLPQMRRASMRQRSVALGLMGFHDALQKLRVAYASQEAIAFADESMEAVSYHAIAASAALACERGAYPAFKGSLWDQAMLPADSARLLERAREGAIFRPGQRLDWKALRARVRTHGLRNANTTAIAPTPVICDICGVQPAVEPALETVRLEESPWGPVAVENGLLVRDLQARGLWDGQTRARLLRAGRRPRALQGLPAEIRELYATAFEIDPVFLIEAAAARQKWIDQGQSLDLYVTRSKIRSLDRLYRYAWRKGLKGIRRLRQETDAAAAS